MCGWKKNGPGDVWCTCVNILQYFMETINFFGYFRYINYHGRHDMYSSLCSCKEEYVMSTAETKGCFFLSS